MRLKTSLNAQHAGPFIGLTLAALFLGLFLALPLGHALFHPGDFCSETCPAHVFEGSLLLLAVALWSLATLHTGLQDRPSARRSLPTRTQQLALPELQSKCRSRHQRWRRPPDGQHRDLLFLC